MLGRALARSSLCVNVVWTNLDVCFINMLPVKGRATGRSPLQARGAALAKNLRNRHLVVAGLRPRAKGFWPEGIIACLQEGAHATLLLCF
jgi:hypothetical protein